MYRERQRGAKCVLELRTLHVHIYFKFLHVQHCSNINFHQTKDIRDLWHSDSVVQSLSVNMGPPKNPYQPYAKDHETLNGPGDQRPTALQIVKDCDAIGKLKGKVVLITG